jgi:hypothetical protein
MLTTPTALAISGLVQTIAYIKLPTVEEYGTLDISSFSFSVDGKLLTQFQMARKRTTYFICSLHVESLKHPFDVLLL